MPGRLLTALAIGMLIASAAAAQEPASRSETEQRLRELNREIAELQKTLEKGRSDHAQAMERIRDLDLEIQDNTNRQLELKGASEERQEELDRLLSQRNEFLEQMAKRHQHLETQVLAAWQMGRESRVKLVLNQDSPARASRLLAYYEYFSQAQAAKIGELREALSGLDEIRAGIDAEMQKIEDLARQLDQSRQNLTRKRAGRVAMVDQLATDIGNDEARLAELERNRRDLETLLERLDDALADIPTDLGEHEHPLRQKGRLPMPIKGRVLHAFGQSRGAGLSWQGWLLEADAGQEIRSIAYGRVAYADWLRGYGLLIIIDHGEGFMSLYGNNESLMFGVGDWVQPGAVIATVGSNPGASQGLYFELRNKGRAVDPAVWVSRR